MGYSHDVAPSNDRPEVQGIESFGEHHSGPTLIRSNDRPEVQGIERWLPVPNGPRARVERPPRSSGD